MNCICKTIQLLNARQHCLVFLKQVNNMSFFGRGSVRQQFEVPVFTAARAASRLRTIVIAAHLGAFVLSLLDAVFLGNFLGLLFGVPEVYGASFPFWLLYAHILKIPLLAFLFYVLGRTRISFGVGFLGASLITLIVIVVVEIVTFFVLLLERFKCENPYCFSTGTGGGSGIIGVPTLSFNIGFFSLIFSIVVRIVEALIVNFLRMQVKIRNETAIEALPTNRAPILNTGTQQLTTVRGIATNIEESVKLLPQQQSYSENLYNRKTASNSTNTYDVSINVDDEEHIVFE